MDEGTLLFFTTEWFLAGARWGALGLVVGLILALVWRSWRRNPAPLLGGLVALTGLVAMPVKRAIPIDLWIGIAMLTGAGLLYRWARKLLLMPALIAAPGAWWVTQEVDLPGEEWSSWFLLGMIVVGAPLVASFDSHHNQRGYGPVLIAVTIGGAYSTLPDTQEILVLFGAVVPVALLAWPKPLASLGAWGAYPVVGVLAWVIAWGGRGRETAIIGAAACLGLLVAEPIGCWISRTSETKLDRLPDMPGGPVLAGLVHAIVVLLAARVAGLQSDTALAAVIAAVLLMLSVAVMTPTGLSFTAGRHRQ